jgi:hypothetical protein
VISVVELKKNYIWVLGIVVCIAALLMTGMFVELLHAVVVIALAMFAYTILQFTANKYGA